MGEELSLNPALCKGIWCIAVEGDTPQSVNVPGLQARLSHIQFGVFSRTAGPFRYLTQVYALDLV